MLARAKSNRSGQKKRPAVGEGMVNHSQLGKRTDIYALCLSMCVGEGLCTK